MQPANTAAFRSLGRNHEEAADSQKLPSFSAFANQTTALFIWMSRFVAPAFPLTLSLSRKGRGNPRTASSYKCKPLYSIIFLLRGAAAQGPKSCLAWALVLISLS